MNQIITIRQQVYNIIKRRIADGTYTHGQRLQEVDLSVELNVSRSPVRSALSQLEAEGLLMGQPNKGVFVRPFTEKEIHDIFEIRTLYECHAIDFLRDHPNETLMEQLLVLKRRTENLYAEIDYMMGPEVNFHYALVESTGNAFLIKSHQFASAITMSYHVLLFAGDNYKETVDSHLKVINALLEQDYDLSKELLKQHLHHAEQSICNAMTQQADD